MKKVLFLTIGIFLLMSCEKPLIEDSAPSQSQGNLTLSILQLEQTPFGDIKNTASDAACTHLNFAVYQGGKRIKQTNQTIDDPAFGTATLQLDEGTYQLVVVAHSSAKNPAMTNPQKIQFTNADGFTDTFLYEDELTVTGESQHLPLSLRRITSRCHFVITDDIPANVTKVRFYYTGGSGAFDATTGFGCVKSKQSVFFDVTDGQKQFDLYTFLHDTQGTVHLLVTAYDAGDNVVTEHDFDVPMTQNSVINISAPLFHTQETGTGTITIILTS